MTETYTFLDKGTIAKPTRRNPHPHERPYVTYTTPSPEDKDWSLTFTEASSPRGADRKPLYYYAVWRFIDDSHARNDYPIFRALAMARNWAPIEDRPIPEPAPVPEPSCDHSRCQRVGYSLTHKRTVYRCLNCQMMTFRNGEPISSGQYAITNADEIRRLRLLEAHRAMAHFRKVTGQE